MSFYLPNNHVGPTGVEPGEFLELPPMGGDGGSPGPGGAGAPAPPATPPPTTAPPASSPPASSPPPAASPRAAGVTRTYAGPGITVHWDAARCVHAGRCLSGAPLVFTRDARPWVRPDAAPADEIAAVIDTCPSGALSYTRTDGAPPGRRGRAAGEDATASTAPDPEGPFAEPGPDVTPVTIRPTPDGPLLVTGPVDLLRPDGSVETAGRLALCRCGRSGSKPHCDGSHLRVGFRAPGAEPG